MNEFEYNAGDFVEYLIISYYPIITVNRLFTLAEIQKITFYMESKIISTCIDLRHKNTI